MTDRKPSKEAPRGATQVDEKDLDRAAGETDASIYFNKGSLEGTTRQDSLAPVAPERGG